VASRELATALVDRQIALETDFAVEQPGYLFMPFGILLATMVPAVPPVPPQRPLHAGGGVRTGAHPGGDHQVVVAQRPSVGQPHRPR